LVKALDFQPKEYGLYSPFPPLRRYGEHGTSVGHVIISVLDSPLVTLLTDFEQVLQCSNWTAPSIDASLIDSGA